MDPMTGADTYSIRASVPLEQLMSRCVLRELFSTIRYQIPLRMRWGSHTRLTDKPGNSGAAHRKHTLAWRTIGWGDRRTAPSLVFQMSEESQTVIWGGPTLPHLQPLLLVYGHQGCPLPQHNALKRSTPPFGRCFICAVPTHVCAWGGLRVVAFSFGRCAYADVRLLNASCPTIALIRRPLLLPRLPSHAHTPPCASHCSGDTSWSQRDHL